MSLPITLIGIDTDPVSHPLTRFAIKQSLLGLDVQEVLFFGGQPLLLGERFVETPRFDSMDTYSEFVFKCLWPFVKTEYILIVHWDGFVANPHLWKKEFLDYDYIGATWAWANDDMRVGNGGFCLRSRKLLMACRDPRVRRHPEIPFGGIEDIVICRLYRKQFEAQGLRFAPDALAEQFSYESGAPNQIPFGFHAPQNMPLFVPEKSLLELAPALKAKIGEGAVMEQFKQHCQLRSYHELIKALE